MVGCLRKVQNWGFSSVVDEYKYYAGLKWRETDIKFMEGLDVESFRKSMISSIYQYQTRRLMFNEDLFGSYNDNDVQNQKSPRIKSN